MGLRDSEYNCADKGLRPNTRFGFPKQDFFAVAVFLAIFYTAHILAHFVNDHIASFDCPQWWPMSIGIPRLPGVKHSLVGVGGVLIFAGLHKQVMKKQCSLLILVLGSTLLILVTNLIQGINWGYIRPMTAGGIQYYSDAIKITDAWVFLGSFVEKQSEFLCHTRTHPPGPVLLCYLINSVFGHPFWISFLWGVTATPISLIFLYKTTLLLTNDKSLSRFLCFLFALSPAVQIYYVATVDAVFASLLTMALYFFIRPYTHQSFVLLGLTLAVASFLSFGVLFFLPVMAGYEWIRRKSLWKTAMSIAVVGIGYILVDRITGFNYLKAFLQASQMENPQGYRLLTTPVSFIFTRVECVAELVFFLGPLMTPLVYRGLRTKTQKPENLQILARLGVVTLLAMFLAGFLHTGESARACLFIYPYFVFALGVEIRCHERQHPEDSSLRPRLLLLVFLQTVVMQLLGQYVW